MFDLSTLRACAIYSEDLAEFEILNEALGSLSAEYPLHLRHVPGQCLHLVPDTWDTDKLFALLRQAGHGKSFASLVADAMVYPTGVIFVFDGPDPFLDHQRWLRQCRYFEDA